MDYKYQLEKGSTKHLCPQCNKKRFVRYLNTETKDYLPYEYGRCDREAKCSYHLDPYKNNYGKDSFTDWKHQKPSFTEKHTQPIKPIYFPNEIFQHTLKGYEQNTFIQNLLNNIPYPFEAHEVEKVISMYYLGSICKGYRKGAITFPFINKDNHVRTIQVKQFDKNNHTIATDFLHSIIERHHTHKKESVPSWLKAYQQNETKVSCLFGEHLLNKYPHNPIALVEAPKTAICGTLYFGVPNTHEKLIWLAVYNLSSLNVKKCQVLENRDVYLFPDLSQTGHAYSTWTNKAKSLNNDIPKARFFISDLLEHNANDYDRSKGSDIADYLIQLDWRKFRSKCTVL